MRRVAIVRIRTERQADIRFAETQDTLAGKMKDPAEAMALNTVGKIATSRQADIATQADCLYFLQTAVQNSRFASR